MKRDNCETRSEFTGNTLRFYVRYLESQDTSNFLGPMLDSTIKGIPENNNNRLRSLLFK